MSDQDPFDRVLRESFGSDTVPALSPGFDRRLTTRLRPRRLTPAGQLALLVYAIAALALSVGVMRAESVGWLPLGLAVLLPLAGAAALRAPRRRPNS